MPTKPIKRQKFIQYLIEHPKASFNEAGHAAGYSENTIRNIGANVIDQPGTKTLAEQFQLDLDKKIPNSRIITKLTKLMDAKKETVTKEGRVVETEDNSIQLAATETVMQAKQLVGKLAQDQGGNQTVNVYIDMREELRQIIGAK